MKSVGVFVDISNLYYSINKKFPGKKLHYKKYLREALQGHFQHRAIAYISQSPEEAPAFIQCLQYFGYQTKCKTNPPESTKKRVHWELAIAMDVVRNIDKLDIVIIGSSNVELVPLLEWVREKGVKCVVMACGIEVAIIEKADYCCEIDEEFFEQ